MSRVSTQGAPPDAVVQLHPVVRIPLFTALLSNLHATLQHTPEATRPEKHKECPIFPSAHIATGLKRIELFSLVSSKLQKDKSKQIQQEVAKNLAHLSSPSSSALTFGYATCFNNEAKASHKQWRPEANIHRRER